MDNVTKKILVVDDENQICKICSNTLTSAGYVVQTTTDPYDALQKVSNEEFELVLTDIRMPHINGLELIRRIKSISPDVPVVIMTGFASMEIAVEAVKQGASNFVRKPFNLNELKIEVQNAIERKNLLRQNIRLKTLVNIFEVSNEITALHDPPKIYTLLLNSAIKETKAERGAIFQLDPENHEIFLRYGFNLNGLLTTDTDIGKRAGLAGQSIIRDSPIKVRSWENGFTNYKSIGEEKWSNFALAVPVKRNGSDIETTMCLYKSASEFSDADLDGAILLANQASVALRNADLVLDLEILFLETMKSLAEMLDARDTYTHGHSLRVAQLSVSIGKVLGLSEQELEDLKLAGNLHDIGKIGITDAILHKPGELTPEEYEIIKTHPEKGCDILKHIKRLSSVVEAVHSHHEWYNGQGYPRRLKKDDIPLAGAIVSVADAFDAMISDRPYRKRKTYDEALEIIEKNSGKQFHPEVVAALRKLTEDTLSAAEIGEHDLQ